MEKVMRIAINTGGGDAPGLNAVIKAVVMGADRRNWEVYGIKNGFEGLLNTGEILRLTPAMVHDISGIGGTIIGTTTTGNPFSMPTTNLAGETEMRDVSYKVMDNFRSLRFDCLIAVGGDGCLEIAYNFYKKGMPVVGVPKTIDNDLAFTDDLFTTVLTFGFDSAVSIATEAIDRLHSNADSNERVVVVEVMGRHAGWIALNSGVSGSADVILIPEIPFDIGRICDHIGQRESDGRHDAIVVVAEGAAPLGGRAPDKGAGELRRQDAVQGGIGEYVAREITKRTGKETRTLVLGRLQRSGPPTTHDRLLALRFGAAAVRMIEEKRFGTMVALNFPLETAVPLNQVIGHIKNVSADTDTVKTARELGISFGD